MKSALALFEGGNNPIVNPRKNGVWEVGLDS